MSFIYYKLPYKNKLLEAAVTEQQVSKDRVLFKPRAFQKASALIAMSRLHLPPNSAISTAARVPEERAKPLQAFIPSGGCRPLCLAAQKDVPLVRGESWEGVRPSEGSNARAFAFWLLGSAPALKTQYREGEARGPN